MLKDFEKLEIERRDTVGNWGEHRFSNIFEIMLSNSLVFDTERAKVLLKTYRSNNIKARFELSALLGQVLYIVNKLGITEQELFSAYQVMVWHLADKKRKENYYV